MLSPSNSRLRAVPFEHMGMARLMGKEAPQRADTGTLSGRSHSRILLIAVKERRSAARNLPPEVQTPKSNCCVQSEGVFRA
jgi:hypothetical protein